MNNLAVETLLAKRQQLEVEQAKMNEKFKAEIEDINMAIETLYGDRFLKITPAEVYDDESQEYIKASQEEI